MGTIAKETHALSDATRPQLRAPGSRRHWRICFVGPGANIHTQRWVRAMIQRGHEVLLVTHDDCHPHGIEVFNPKYHMKWFGKIPKLRGAWACWLAHRAVLRFRPDIVHMHWLDPNPLTARLARSWPNFVLSVWGSDVVWDKPEAEPARQVAGKRRLLAAARSVTATSAFLAEATKPFMSNGRAIHVVPFGVDLEQFRPGEKAPHPGRVVIGYIKHYLPKYGPDILLRSMQIIKAKCPQAFLVMNGTSDPAWLLRLAKELSIEDCIRIGPPIAHADVPATLRSFDIFAMPSVYHSETFGVAAVEASACGLPVVATRVGGVPEVVDHPNTGLLVEPGDPKELAEALISLIGDPARRESMGRAGRKLVERQYDWSANVSSMEHVYDVLTSPGLSEHG